MYNIFINQFMIRLADRTRSIILSMLGGIDGFPALR